jgi:ferritin-like metal-binding protein YciE
MLLDNLSDLFQRGLEYAWDSENLLVKSLTAMIDAASAPELKQALDLHLIETKGHIFRLEQIFTRLERSPAAEKNEPIRIIIEECEKMIGHIERSPLLDAALLFCFTQVEHYEIGLYDSLAGMSRALELDELTSLLDQIVIEEKTAANSLMRLGNGSINPAARSTHNPPPFALI